MTVYVDNMFCRYRRMKMCHMIADTEDELHAMASRIGISRKHHQGDHYDVCISMRTRAVEFGARELTTRELIFKMRELGLR